MIDTRWVRLKEFYGGTTNELSNNNIQCDNNYEEEKPYDRYFLILFMSTIEFIVYLLAVTFAAKFTVKSNVSTNQYTIIKWNYLIMSLILSSFGKGFVFLMMIWDYDEKFNNFSIIIDIMVFTSNALALKVFLDVHTLKSVSLIIIGQAVKLLFQITMLFFFYDQLKILCISNFCVSL